MLTAKQLKWINSSMKEEIRDAADITRLNSAAMSSTTVSMCATSPQPITTGTAGNLNSDKDCSTINSLRVKGSFSSSPIIVTTAQADAVYGEAEARMLWVWYYKPGTPPDASGNMPPVTDCLVSNDIDSMHLQGDENAGRFTILFDRRIKVGRALQLTDGGKGSEGRAHTVPFDYTIQIHKDQFYNIGSASAGRYDTTSPTAGGIVTKGLLVGYLLKTKGAGVAGADACNGSVKLATRLNYSA